VSPWIILSQNVPQSFPFIIIFYLGSNYQLLFTLLVFLKILQIAFSRSASIPVLTIVLRLVMSFKATICHSFCQSRPAKLRIRWVVIGGFEKENIVICFLQCELRAVA